MGGQPTTWRSQGILKEGKKGWWVIEEAPIGLWSDNLKAHIEYLWTGDPPAGSKKKKGDIYLSDAKWKGSVNTVLWEIKPTKDFIPDINVSGNFKCLQTTGSLTNMYVIDENGYPRKYSRPEDLLIDFCKKRMEYYDMRKNYWLEEWEKDLAKETDRYKYVKAVVDYQTSKGAKGLNMHQTDEKLEEDMLALGLRKISNDKEDSETEGSFNYLLGMQMRSMTIKKMEEIKKEMDKLKAKVADMQNKSASDLWKEDLAIFKVAYAKFLKTRKEE
jgi:DNA topoisomerase-2